MVKRHLICASALLKKHEIESVSLLSNVKVEQAAIRAGYSEKTAGQAASNLFKKLKFRTRFQTLGPLEIVDKC